eukprot:TRINITY_DN7584_c0_g1_i1.p1 TRINITY_DN7584_c0_g1~~TRINITY_DN7584_c0_g1_i1.p1  ORF type:complete len:974 (+),score=231.99 TRINITY_DN7584_c0_g1_i1:136-2922(+)
MDYLEGIVWKPENINILLYANAILSTEQFFIESDTYTQSVIPALYTKSLNELNIQINGSPFFDGTENLERPLPLGEQSCPEFHKNATAGEAYESIPKYDSGRLSIGETVYTNDIIPPVGTLYGSYIYATIGCGKLPFESFLVMKDTVSELEGVKEIIWDAHDLTPQPFNLSKSLQPFVYRRLFPEHIIDEEEDYFKIVYHGYPIALVVADSQLNADYAATHGRDLLQNSYIETPINLQFPPIGDEPWKQEHRHLHEDDPDAYNDIWLPEDHRFMGYLTDGKYYDSHPGEVEQTPGTCTVNGQVNQHGQLHFYLENQACLVIPLEDKYIVNTACQGLMYTRAKIANALGILANKVSCYVRRTGGDFGGKQSQASKHAVAASIAARVLKKPVKINLHHDYDTRTTGRRSRYRASYYGEFDKDTGKIDTAVYNHEYAGGMVIDAGWEITNRTFMCSDGCYKIPNFRADGQILKSNEPPQTSYRAFGTPQAYLACESLIDHVAFECGMEPEQIREINFYQPGEETPYGQSTAEDYLLHMVWKQLKEKSAYDARAEDIIAFNNENLYKKRGIAMTPMKYGFNLGTPYKGDNIANARVAILAADGSITVQHGGVENGQGIHTKMAQIAVKEFRNADRWHQYRYFGDLPTIENVEVLITSSDTIVNTKETAASIACDQNGMALVYACQAVRERIENWLENASDDIIAKVNHPEQGGWRQLIGQAFMGMVNLQADGFYCAGNEIYWDPDTRKGSPMGYYGYAATCSEVEIDVLTGEFKIIRSDVIGDTGCSLNPGIDIGQIEGGFVHGLGFHLHEGLQVQYESEGDNPAGKLLNNTTWGYKIPDMRSIPEDFRVHLLDRPNVSKTKTPFRSKGIGEPPLVLSNSAYWAIKKAIFAARKQIQNNQYFVLDAPANIFRIKELCGDQINHLKDRHQLEE